MLLGKLTAKREDILQQAETIFQLITENKKYFFETNISGIEFKEYDGKELVKCAKIEDLMEIIVMPSIKVHDPKLVDTLLMTMPYYCKIKIGLEKLCKKYLSLLSDVNSKWRIRWRSNILSLISYWVGNPSWLCPSQFSSNFIKIWKNLLKEAKKISKKQALPKSEERSLDSINLMFLHRQKKDEKFSVSSVTDSSFDILTWDDSIFAQQLTLYDAKLFSLIPVVEFLNVNFLEPSKSPFYAKFIGHFNSLGKLFLFIIIIYI